MAASRTSMSKRFVSSRLVWSLVLSVSCGGLPKQGQRDFTALPLYAVSCLTTILDSGSMECENTYTPARGVALFCEHFVPPTASAGCGVRFQ